MADAAPSTTPVDYNKLSIAELQELANASDANAQAILTRITSGQRVSFEGRSQFLDAANNSFAAEEINDTIGKLQQNISEQNKDLPDVSNILERFEVEKGNIEDLADFQKNYLPNIMKDTTVKIKKTILAKLLYKEQNQNTAYRMDDQVAAIHQAIETEAAALADSENPEDVKRLDDLVSLLPLEVLHKYNDTKNGSVFKAEFDGVVTDPMQVEAGDTATEETIANNLNYDLYRLARFQQVQAENPALQDIATKEQMDNAVAFIHDRQNKNAALAAGGKNSPVKKLINKSWKSAALLSTGVGIGLSVGKSFALAALFTTTPVWAMVAAGATTGIVTQLIRSRMKGNHKTDKHWIRNALIKGALIGAGGSLVGVGIGAFASDYIHHAIGNIFNDGFNNGFNAGHVSGLHDGITQAAKAAASTTAQDHAGNVTGDAAASAADAAHQASADALKTQIQHMVDQGVFDNMKDNGLPIKHALQTALNAKDGVDWHHVAARLAGGGYEIMNGDNVTGANKQTGAILYGLASDVVKSGLDPQNTAIDASINRSAQGLIKMGYASTLAHT